MCSTFSGSCTSLYHLFWMDPNPKMTCFWLCLDQWMPQSTWNGTRAAPHVGQQPEVASKHWIWWLVQKQPELTNTRTKAGMKFLWSAQYQDQLVCSKVVTRQTLVSSPSFSDVIYCLYLLASLWLENLQAFPPSVLCFSHVFSSSLTKFHQVNIRAQERRFYKSHARTWIFQCWAVIMHLVLEPSVPVSKDWTGTRSDFRNWNLYFWRTRLATRFRVPFMCGTKLEPEQRFCRTEMRGSFIKVKNRPTLEYSSNEVLHTRVILQVMLSSVPLSHPVGPLFVSPCPIWYYVQSVENRWSNTKTCHVIR